MARQDIAVFMVLFLPGCTPAHPGKNKLQPPKAQQPEPIYELKLTEEQMNQAFGPLISKAVGQAVEKTIRETCDEFEIRDPTELSAFVTVLMEPDSGPAKFIKTCYIQPSAQVLQPHYYQKTLNKIVLQYSRLGVPSARPSVFVFVEPGMARSEYVFDRRTEKWRKELGALTKQGEAVREAIAKALKHFE